MKVKEKKDGTPENAMCKKDKCNVRKIWNQVLMVRMKIGKLLKARNR